MIRNHASMLDMVRGAFCDGLDTLDGQFWYFSVATLLVMLGVAYRSGRAATCAACVDAKGKIADLQRQLKDKDAELASKSKEIDHLTGQNAALTLDVRAHERAREIVK